jgi:hypothetical protein
VTTLGRVSALAAEAALWITGAALIAGAAGMHWSVDLPGIDMGGLTGSTPSAGASASRAAGSSASLNTGPSASLAIKSGAPAASPALSTIVQKYQAYVARPDFQFKGKYANSSTFTLSGTAYQITQSGTMSYEAGDDSDSRRETVNGAVTTFEYVHIGSVTYESKNGAAWTKSARSDADIASDKLLFAPSMLFADMGVETKNGAQLHRLDVADPAAFSKALLKTSNGGTDAQVTYTAWVQDDGTPAAFRVEGWVVEPVSGVSTKITVAQEFRVIATSGVTITAPI